MHMHHSCSGLSGQQLVLYVAGIFSCSYLPAAMQTITCTSAHRQHSCGASTSQARFNHDLGVASPALAIGLLIAALQCERGLVPTTLVGSTQSSLPDNIHNSHKSNSMHQPGLHVAQRAVTEHLRFEWCCWCCWCCLCMLGLRGHRLRRRNHMALGHPHMSTHALSHQPLLPPFCVQLLRLQAAPTPCQQNS